MKIVNESLRDSYKQTFTYCEACVYLEGKFPVREIELHHIFGGDNRTDEWWNYICVCRLHHEKATTHSLKYGAESRTWNNSYLAIKFIKEEIREERLKELKRFEEVIPEVERIKESDIFKFARLSGFIVVYE